jgi:hypothetical protein
MFVEDGKYFPTMTLGERYILLQAAQGANTLPATKAFLTDVATNRNGVGNDGDQFRLLQITAAIQVACTDRLNDPHLPLPDGLGTGLLLMALDVEFIQEYPN